MAKKLSTVGILNVLMVYAVVMLIGCAGGISVVPLSVKVQNADRKVEAAAMVVISNDLKPEKKRELLADKRTLYDEAIALYIECAASNKYNQRAHFQIAKIYKSPYHEVKLVLSESGDKHGRRSCFRDRPDLCRGLRVGFAVQTRRECEAEEERPKKSQAMVH